MAMVIPAIQKELEAELISALTQEFAGEASADPTSHKRIASAVSKAVAKVLINAIQSQAEVLPGISSAGSPGAVTSVSPGKIF